MRIHPLEKIKAIKDARRGGRSILELVKEFDVPKTTVWHYIHDIKLSKVHVERLRTNQGGSVVRYRKQMEKARSEAKEIIGSLKNIQQIAPIVVSLLYWAEGNKKGFIFTNTDENMIQVYLKILRSWFEIRDSDITVMARITKRASSRKSISYWRRVTGLPLANIKTDINHRNNKSRAKYGICRIRVKKGGYLSKLINCLNEELTSIIKSSTM